MNTTNILSRLVTTANSDVTSAPALLKRQYESNVKKSVTMCDHVNNFLSKYYPESKTAVHIGEGNIIVIVSNLADSGSIDSKNLSKFFVDDLDMNIASMNMGRKGLVIYNSLFKIEIRRLSGNRLELTLVALND